jgi:hypothetical protein
MERQTGDPSCIVPTLRVRGATLPGPSVSSLRTGTILLLFINVTLVFHAFLVTQLSGLMMSFYSCEELYVSGDSDVTSQFPTFVIFMSSCLYVSPLPDRSV